ncbi:unnamed protein product [Camellia sinensis]
MNSHRSSSRIRTSQSINILPSFQPFISPCLSPSDQITHKEFPFKSAPLLEFPPIASSRMLATTLSVPDSNKIRVLFADSNKVRFLAIIALAATVIGVLVFGCRRDFAVEGVVDSGYGVIRTQHIVIEELLAETFSGSLGFQRARFDFGCSSGSLCIFPDV